MLCQAFNSIFDCYFKPFLCLLDVKKPKIFRGLRPKPPPGPCHGPAMRLTAPPRPLAVFSAKRVSCSYNLGAFGAADVDFFSVLTPGATVQKTSVSMIKEKSIQKLTSTKLILIEKCFLTCAFVTVQRHLVSVDSRWVNSVFVDKILSYRPNIF